jgi:isoleucyl-tRNA synthetase
VVKPGISVQIQQIREMQLMFAPVPKNVDFPQQEEQILAFWNERQIYDKTLAQRKDAPNYVFYEGPPTANGKPHPGHCLTRAIKDVFPRYRTMRGFRCERKAGWDTHGLPVEVEVCKELGIHSKEEIEAYGIEPFIQLCQQSVWRYMQEWERLTARLGFWVDLDQAYVTYHQSYIESVWWSLKNLFDRGLLYQGHKIVWWWAQGGTALSSGEVGQGYRQVADPSVFVRFPLVDQRDTSLLVWTTTPWTLPSNQFAAVHPDLEYATIVDPSDDKKRLIVAADLQQKVVELVSKEKSPQWITESTCRGQDLIGKRYVPPFDYYYRELGDVQAELAAGGEQHVAWRVVAADFVTVDSGTGVVHQAPAFGEVDFALLMAERERFSTGSGPELICAVGPDGKFTSEAPDYAGRWVKEADKDISRNLRERGLLYHLDQYLHDYPFCWRADEDPLIQYPRKSWFIKTTQFKDAMLANNQQINWLPGHIKNGRFGNFLESNVDWALSRERYWGTPLPIWVCSETGQQQAIDSYDALLAKPGVTGEEVWLAAKKSQPELSDHLRVHKPYIDAITYDSPFAKGARMQRVPEVIDCWYDSGAMPFAQWGYPHQGHDQFLDQFPADFISEAIDQTRGWFYSQLAISTLLFSKDAQLFNQAAGNASPGEHLESVDYPHPFANCIVLGLMLAESYVCEKDSSHRFNEETNKCETCGGKVQRKIEKMSKRLRNYREPQEIFDKHGADALRWYFFANQPPWTELIYSERAIKDSIPEFLLRLWNVFSFFNIYANMDGFDPGALLKGKSIGQVNGADFAGTPGFRPVVERGELDRWIISELQMTCQRVVAQMDLYDNYGACASINAFVDSLSNWYVRRSRSRFWEPTEESVQGKKSSAEKIDAYWTLYECLVTTAKIVAPFVPFIADTIWQNLAGVFGERAVESVHLCDYPVANSQQIDADLSRRMALVREIASLGRSARMENRLKVRQPLASVKVILVDNQDQPWLEAHDAILKDELNVKRVEYVTDAEMYITYQVQPNFKALGPRVGKLIPQVKKLLGEADGGALLNQLNSTGKVSLDVGGEIIELTGEDIQVRLQAKEGWAAAQGAGSVVVLATELTEELIREGVARDFMRLIQDIRKEMDLEYSDRIEIVISEFDQQLETAIRENLDYVQNETLAELISFASDSAIEMEKDAVTFERQIGELTFKITIRVAKPV